MLETKVVSKPSYIGSCRFYKKLLVVWQIIILLNSPQCDQDNLNGQQCRQRYASNLAEAQRFVDSSTLKPSIILILPQSFKVPTNPLRADEYISGDQTKIQQYVAIINNAQNERDDQLLRQHYKKLSLQIRDARQQITGQLFYEHVFDYFPSSQHLLIPINLDQVSQITPSNHSDSKTKLQQLIVSIRPHQLDSGFGSENIEFVSSAPILVETIPSSDGRRSFSIVQTDKPVYKPDEKVRIRALIINENFRPIVRDEFRLQIKNPQMIVVEEIRFPRPPNENVSSTRDGAGVVKHEPLFVDHIFSFPPEPTQGTWLVQLLHSDPIANDTTSFEVKEYVLPPFEIQFDSPRYILPNTTTISIGITAKYHYGKPVQGKVMFKLRYSHRESPTDLRQSLIALSDIKLVDPDTGKAEYKFNLNEFKKIKWFPEIAGHNLVIEAKVSESSTGHIETALDSSCLFVTTPYLLSFDNSIIDFKPGLKQELSVQLMDSLTHQPGPAGQKIVASYRNKNRTLLGSIPFDIYDTEAVTDQLGRAIFRIGPVNNDIDEILVSMKLLGEGAQSPAIELARGEHRLTRYNTQNGWIHLINKTCTHLSIGEEFVSDILIRDSYSKIYYMITARGQILTMDTINSDGLIKFNITEAMVPSIRLVLFALTYTSDGLLSDSMRISVGQNMECGLSLDYVSNNYHSSAQNTYKPNDVGRLTIQARHGDLVSLIGVDNAVYALNNRTRLDSLRIIERIKRLDLGCGFGGGQNNLDVFHNAGLMLFKDSATSMMLSENNQNLLRSFIGSSCLTQQSFFRYLEDAQMGYSKPFGRLIVERLSHSGRLNIRKKRSEVDVQAILRRYKDPIHRACCRLGTLEDSPHNRDCKTRAKIVQKYMHQSEFKPCAHIYETCCANVFGTNPQLVLSTVGPLRDFEARIMKTRNEVHHSESIPYGQLGSIEANTLIRKDFRETWLFELVPVHDHKGIASIDVRLPHTITSWSISAIALNQNKPMCLMPRPYKITTFQEVFIQVTMPYKVIQGEQIDLIAKLFNYSPKSQDVLVYMYGVADVCSEAEPGERSERKRVRVDKHSTQSVLFPMIPLRTGRYPIKIVAIALTSNSSDIVERYLNVVPKGTTVIDETTFSLDPLNQQRRSKRELKTGNLVDEIDSSRGLQRSKVRLTPSQSSESIVPNTHECFVSAIGDKLGQTVQTAILDVENLIRLPHGCGEQVMIYLGPTLYTVKYLDSINKLTGDTRWRAIRYIQSGYKRILNFRRENGAFSAFARRAPSIWLTAFVSKLLCQTERTPFIAEEVHVDKTVINSALNWLIETQNKTSGGWVEWNPVYHKEMLGGTLKENVLTAFVTIALNECSHHSMDLVEEGPIVKEGTIGHVSFADQLYPLTDGLNRLEVALHRANQTLTLSRFNAVNNRNPYALALIAYALSSSNRYEASLAMNDLLTLAERSQSRNQLYWRGDHQVETAAYALQALIDIAPYAASRDKNGESRTSNHALNSDAVAIANWLSSQRSYTGAFESTQDTVVALEALSKYAQLQSSARNSLLSQPKLLCNVTVNNRTRRSIEFKEDNALVQQTFKLDLDLNNGEMLDITTSGSGLGTMTVKLKYNVLQEADKFCRFNIEPTIEEWQPKLFSNGRIKTTDHSSNAAHDLNKDLPIDNQSNDTAFEDDYFRTFDKSMLSELNLIDQPDPSEPIDSKHTQAPQKPNVTLRLRRSTENTSITRSSEGNTSESWTSKVVSTLRSKLSSWVAPKRKNEQQNTTSAMIETSSTTRAPTMTSDSTNFQFERPRKSSTSRRSTNSHGSSPSVSPSIVIPCGLYNCSLNTLSDKLEISVHNNESSNVHTTSSYQLSPTDLSHRLVLLLKVCVYHESSVETEMAIIEVGILSGFKPNEADLEQVIKEVGTPALKYELSPDRSLVIFYMHHVPNTGNYCLQFRLIRDSLVYNLQSGYIRVYDYYNPRRSCSSFYTPSRVTNLLSNKCDSTHQVCQCATKSLCPMTNKLVSLGEIHQVNTTSAKNQLIELICSNRFDLVSLVRLKNVKYLQVGKMIKLLVKVKTDLKGNLTKIIDAQRQQKTQLSNSIREPQQTLASTPIDFVNQMAQTSATNDDISADETSLDLLSMTIDSDCVRDDPYLLHLAHPNQWKLGGELMILFARSQNIERKLFKSTVKRSAGLNHAQGPRPKPNIWANSDHHQQQETLTFDDTQQLQYSLLLSLDKDTILHDLTYQAKIGPREAMNNLILWLELRSRRERWTCPLETSN